MPAQDRRHEQGGDLVVGPRTVGGPGHEAVDLLAAEGVGVPLLPDDVDRAHRTQKYSSPW